MEKNLQKIYVTYYNLLTEQDLWQALCQFLSIIFLKKFIELNVNSDTMTKNCETYQIKYKYCDYFLEYKNFKDNLIECKCLCCNKNYQHKFDEKLKQRFFNTHNFSNCDNNKFSLLLQKGVYPLNIWMIGKNS